MMRRLVHAMALIGAIAAMGLGGASVARAHNIDCSGTVGGAATVTTINGNVTVRDNASCTLKFVEITGNLLVQRGGTLIVDAYDEPSTIDGNVEADRCASLMVGGDVTIDRNVLIAGCSGKGQNSFQGPGIVIKGNFECVNNAGPCEAWLGEVDGNVQIQNNGSLVPSDVSLTVIRGRLECRHNSPAPTHSHGFDWVGGTPREHGHGFDDDGGYAQGQCAGFSTASTSIGTNIKPVVSCAALGSIPSADFPVPNTVITSAVDTPAAGTLPERCIVNGYVNDRISPVDNCEYRDGFQVQLPLSADWNGRFMFQGGGGTEGSVPTATGSDSGSAGANFGIIRGYAVASQDGGHENSFLKACGKSNNEFYVDPMATIDNGYQSINVATLNAKYIVAAYYGDGPDHSYWVGCSEGGRQGMVMSQLFPQYFDGIVAGDPVYDTQLVNLAEIWSMEQILNVYQSTPGLPPLQYVSEPPPQAHEPILYPALPVADQSLFETALLQACDSLDGVADGVIDNLPACQKIFDPTTATYVSGGVTYQLECTGAKNATCLSPLQIQAIEKINQGSRTSGGLTIKAPAGSVAEDHADNTVPGYAYDGGYMTTVGIPARNVGTPTTPPSSESLVAQLPYAFISPSDPSFDPLSFNFDTDLGMLTVSTPKIYSSTSLDISKFINYGHKIIWYHGLTDPGPQVLGTITYYGEMANQHGGLQAAQRFSRLYPVPNMDHCTGGATTDQFDMLTPLVDWVEHGTAPGPIIAKGVNFNAATYQVGFVSGLPDNAPTTRSRPLCPYPQEARFTGSVKVVNGVPVASDPAELADASNYTCIMPPPPYLQ